MGATPSLLLPATLPKRDELTKAVQVSVRHTMEVFEKVFHERMLLAEVADALPKPTPPKLLRRPSAGASERRLSSSPLPSAPRLEGWLTKLGDVMKSWRRRYFVALPKQHNFKVLYFESDELARDASRARGSMHLCGYALTPAVEGKRFGITLTPPHNDLLQRRVWQLVAEDSEQQKAWVAVLRDATRNTRPKCEAAKLTRRIFVLAAERARWSLSLTRWWTPQMSEVEEITLMALQVVYRDVLDSVIEEASAEVKQELLTAVRDFCTAQATLLWEQVVSSFHDLLGSFRPADSQLVDVQNAIDGVRAAVRENFQYMLDVELHNCMFVAASTATHLATKGIGSSFVNVLRSFGRLSLSLVTSKPLTVECIRKVISAHRVALTSFMGPLRSALESVQAATYRLEDERELLQDVNAPWLMSQVEARLHRLMNDALCMLERRLVAYLREQAEAESFASRHRNDGEGAAAAAAAAGSAAGEEKVDEASGLRRSSRAEDMPKLVGPLRILYGVLEEMTDEALVTLERSLTFVVMQAVRLLAVRQLYGTMLDSLTSIPMLLPEAMKPFIVPSELVLMELMDACERKVRSIQHESLEVELLLVEGEGSSLLEAVEAAWKAEHGITTAVEDEDSKSDD